MLEVGCGRGALAASLQKKGHRVVGLEPNPESAEIARSKGVRVVNATIQEYQPDFLYDVVLFTRSLHHIGDLDATLRKALTQLGSKGLLIIEDFSWEEMDEKTATWFYGLLALQEKGNEPESTLLYWQEEHHHEPALDTGVALRQSLLKHCDELQCVTAPYLYRYFSENGEAVFRRESNLIRAGAIKPIGLRLVGEKKA